MANQDCGKRNDPVIIKTRLLSKKAISLVNSKQVPHRLITDATH